MKIAIFSLLTALTIASCSTSQKPAADYVATQQSVETTLKFLTSDALQGREAGSKGLEQAAQYLEDNFVKNGIKPYFVSYKDTIGNYTKTTYNVVGYLEGTDPVLKKEFVIFGAHYDHIGIAKDGIAGDTINNGANDDASGVTAVTELANYFGRAKNNKRSILFCYFTAEEVGLLGSKHLSDKLKKQNFNLYAMLNFEMIGVPMKTDMLAYITGWGMSNMGDKVNEYTGKNIVGNLPAEMQYQLFRRSDNYPFYTNFNVPAQTICTFDFENYAYYHHVNDEFENLDTAHMTNFINTMLPAITKMVNAPTKEIVLKK